MLKDERIEYNRKYYEKNKEKILKKALTKIECEFCKRQVISNIYLKHTQLPICKKYQLMLIERDQRLKMSDGV